MPSNLRSFKHHRSFRISLLSIKPLYQSVLSLNPIYIPLWDI